MMEHTFQVPPRYYHYRSIRLISHTPANYEHCSLSLTEDVVATSHPPPQKITKEFPLSTS